MPKPKELDDRIITRLPSDLARQAKRKAKAQRRTLSDVIRELLRAWLGQ